MAEKSTRIPEGSSGQYISTRDAIETDSSANARVIQLVDTSSRQVSTWTALRGTLAVMIDADDSAADMSAFSETTIEAGDKSSLVVKVTHYWDSLCSVDLTPICYTSGGDMSILETKTSAVGSVDFYTADGNTLAPVLAWDLLGAYEVAIFISGLTASNKVFVQGAVI